MRLPRPFMFGLAILWGALATVCVTYDRAGFAALFAMMCGIMIERCDSHPP